MHILLDALPLFYKPSALQVGIQEENTRNATIRGASGGAFGAFAPPKILKHCIEILTFAETFKE